MWRSEILELGDGTVLVECGPMRMFVEASIRGARRPDLSREAAGAAIGFLEDVARSGRCLKAPALDLEEPLVGTLPRIMWKAARLIGDNDLTPMAAVAGTIADATADFLVGLGADRAVVNNGGDVALRLLAEESLYLGIRPDVAGGDVSHRIRVSGGMGIGGAATSGLGGRSFTRGVASAVTVFASSCAQADAAATAVANATYIPSKAVLRVPAESVDPATDLRGRDVTAFVGELTASEIEIALGQGLAKAEALAERNIIHSACIFVKGILGTTRRIHGLLEALSQ